eukprot:CAMPEP_0168442020 /NCGR_PEP_ID=MMETSP0228-20121227/43792_1 /TAXON_ID=133427 /ORGANISM="Protoceratium reticulatum, Strain CCCM 535 (=CCMP 1889)" /LENGTH=389 /DNA_ID=CAMNT_0008456367 /DNA_START=65 /DNA_END=1235 /DNA_ORIENTATION=-
MSRGAALELRLPLSAIAPGPAEDALPDDHPLHWLTATPESSPRACTCSELGGVSARPSDGPGSRQGAGGLHWPAPTKDAMHGRPRGTRGGKRHSAAAKKRQDGTVPSLPAPAALSQHSLEWLLPSPMHDPRSRSTTASETSDDAQQHCQIPAPCCAWPERTSMAQPIDPAARPAASPVPSGGIVVARTLPSPPFGDRHRFHAETAGTGALSGDARYFTKELYHGRLSVITEDRVHSCGTMNYVVRFTGGELSNADGVGFVFSPALPCPKNIKRIVSIFANRTGRICIRAYDRVVRCAASVKPLEVGDWVSVTMNLEDRTASFAVWAADGSSFSSAPLAFGAMLADAGPAAPRPAELACGYFACVVKHSGVALSLASEPASVLVRPAQGG